MTFKEGFVLGGIGGTGLTLIATGRTFLIEFTEQGRGFALVCLFIVFLATEFLTIYRVTKPRAGAPFGTTTDGFLGGISFMEATIVFFLYGFRI